MKNDMKQLARELSEREQKPAAVLVSVVLDDGDEMDTDSSLDELEELLETAGGFAYARLVQSRQKPDPATYLGKGKLYELKEICQNAGVDLVIFDCELTPAQISNMEKVLETARVIDRTMLILDIFARNAKTREGMLQVQIAGLRYSLPRLAGQGAEMSRLGGGIGTRGPGESRLEEERRQIKRRILSLEEELKELEKNRRTQRKSREKSGLYRIAVAGYTNAGKSTLLNALCEENILAENKLFATLDPTTRRWSLPEGEEVLLTDTVGFINRLPHHLVEAFRSTLDEVVDCDLIFLVCDASDPKFTQKLRITEKVIASLFEEKEQKPVPYLYVLNKSDLPESRFNLREFPASLPSVSISAKEKAGLDLLAEKAASILRESRRETRFFFPHADAGRIDLLYRTAKVESTEYEENGVRVIAVCDEKTKGMLARYLAPGEN